MSDNNKCDPRGRIKVWLALFDEYDETERPIFVYRRLTADEWDQLSEDYDSFHKIDEPKARRNKLIELAGFGLVDWSSQVAADTGELIPFSIAELRRVINHVEAVEVIGTRLAGGSITKTDKKKLESPD